MIIPRIQNEKYTGGCLALPEVISVTLDGDEAQLALNALNVFLPKVTIEANDDGIITFKKAEFEHDEAYSIVINDEKVAVKYADALGARNAASTIAQLYNGGKLPKCELADHPKFAVRSLMLDLARGVGRKEEIKELVVRLAMFKYNRLHLHLIDSQGVAWQSQCYPLLTGPRGDQYSMQYFNELGKFCESLGIEVLPEIEVPAHNRTILRCYPELGCEVDETEHPSKWTLCAGNDEIFTFYKNIIGELIEMFPNCKTIHIGGDEVNFGDIESQQCNWLYCPKCMALGYDSMQEIFYYTIGRVYDIVKAYGKEVAMWSDWVDIANPCPLQKDIQMNFWRIAGSVRGPHVGCTFEKFLEQGYSVVNAHFPETYIDEKGYANAEKLNDWTPTARPESDAKYHSLILGGECCAWEFGNEERYRFYRFTIHAPLGLFADRLWNSSVVEYDDEYETALTRAILGHTCPTGLNVFKLLGTIMFEAKTTELGVIDENTPSDDALREAMLSLIPIAVSDCYGHVAALAYIECMQWIIEHRQ